MKPPATNDRVAISNSRLIAHDGKVATFKWQDYRAKGGERAKVMTLASDEFMCWPARYRCPRSISAMTRRSASFLLLETKI